MKQLSRKPLLRNAMEHCFICLFFLSEFAGYESPSKPEVKIMKCISFQKFRYCGENRPGKKYQDKDFIQLAVSMMVCHDQCIN